MRKYYTRPCNFYYGNYAKKLIKIKKALPLAGNQNIAFDQLEIFQRKKKGIVKGNFFHIDQIKNISNTILPIIKNDLKRIISKRKNILGLSNLILDILFLLLVIFSKSALTKFFNSLFNFFISFIE